MPRRVCIFGDDRTATREHIFGSWTDKYLPKNGAYELVEGPRVSGKRYRQAGTLAGIYQPRIVCRECNVTWLSQIEQRAESAGLGAMITPQRGDLQVVLDPSQLRAIATWAAKVGLFMPYVNKHPEWVWPAHLGAFLRTDRPPDHFAVWLGAYAGTGPYSSIHVGRVRALPARLVTFHIGHALFQVFLGEDQSPYGVGSPDVTSRGQPVLLRIWPPRGEAVTWPTLAVDAGVIERLADLAPAAIRA